MNKIFVRETDDLKGSILRLAAEIDKRMTTVLNAISAHDKATLEAIMEADRDIDAWEIEIEEECLKILALHQPVAKDLRFVVAVMKINNDLERVGDILVNIADRGCRLQEYQECDLFEKIKVMGKLAADMLRESLGCLISLDVPLDRRHQARRSTGRDERRRDKIRYHHGFRIQLQHRSRCAVPLPQHGARPRENRRPCHEYRRGCCLSGRRLDHPTWKQKLRHRGGTCQRSEF